MLPLICHHKTNKNLRAGICHDYEVFMATVGLETTPQPTIMAVVSWDESFLTPENELSTPEDARRSPLMVLIPAYELVFDGPYVAPIEDNEETQEAILVADYVKEKTPELYQQILDSLDAEEIEQDENNQIA
jgi:hypothetical protein